MATHPIIFEYVPFFQLLNLKSITKTKDEKMAIFNIFISVFMALHFLI